MLFYVSLLKVFCLIEAVFYPLLSRTMPGAGLFISEHKSLLPLRMGGLAPAIASCFPTGAAPQALEPVTPLSELVYLGYKEGH